MTLKDNVVWRINNMKSILIAVSIILIVLVLGILVLELFNREMIDSKFEDVCDMNLKIICNRFYRHAILSKLESPITTQWCDKMIPHSDRGRLFCHIEKNENSKSSYAINKSIEKYDFNDLPDDLVLFFESDLGWNGVGGKDDVNYDNHRGGLAGIVFVRGTTTHSKKETVDKYRWD